MANDWIKMRLDLAEDPAVIEMAETLGVREETIVGYCHAFWSWVSRQCHDGTVTGVTLESLGRRINVPGFPELLRDVGWLNYDNSNCRPVMTIPNFDRHLSKGAKERGLAAIRKKKSRLDSVPEKSQKKRDKNVTRYTLLFSNSSLNSSSKKGVSDADVIAVPEELSTPEFKSAWALWERHRADRKSPLTPTSVDRQIAKLAKLGHAKAIATIEHTIEKGWLGLFEPDDSNGHKPKRSAPREGF